MVRFCLLIMVSFLVNGSLLIAAGDVPLAKSGFNLLRPTQRELERMAHNLSRDEKIALSIMQLREIIPLKIMEKVPFEILREMNFSLGDDDHSRALKYIKLGSTVLNCSTPLSLSQKHEAAYLAYLHALHHLRMVAPQLPAGRLLDYYLSLAQIERWAASCYLLSGAKDKSYVIELLHESLDSLKKAQALLTTEIPEGRIFSFAIAKIKRIVDSYIDRLDARRLQSLAQDAVTRLAISNSEEHYRSYIDLKAQRAKQKLQEVGVEEVVLQNTIKHYVELLQNKVFQQQKTLQEKREFIKKQDVLLNYHKLIEQGIIPLDIRAKVEREQLEKQLVFLDTYKHLRFVHAVVDLSQFPKIVEFEMKKKILEELELIKKMF